MAKKDLNFDIQIDIIGDFVVQISDIEDDGQPTSIIAIPINRIAKVSLLPFALGNTTHIFIFYNNNESDATRILYQDNLEQAQIDYNKILNTMIINRIKNRR